mmetsp:Transcript_85791/g.228009  ORF Transcript_85791/g.228009 Transcript_85791/m.228009 type:complete len:234 (+) Transcript_85791:1160-1861(+)
MLWMRVHWLSFWRVWIRRPPCRSAGLSWTPAPARSRCRCICPTPQRASGRWRRRCRRAAWLWAAARRARPTTSRRSTRCGGTLCSARSLTAPCSGALGPSAWRGSPSCAHRRRLPQPGAPAPSGWWCPQSSPRLRSCWHAGTACRKARGCWPGAGQILGLWRTIGLPEPGASSPPSADPASRPPITRRRRPSRRWSVLAGPPRGCGRRLRRRHERPRGLTRDCAHDWRCGAVR